MRVVASTNVYGSIVRAVGGDRVTVTAIIHGPDADPHEYEASPADAAAVNDAALIIVNGGGYDDFAAKLVDVLGRQAHRHRRRRALRAPARRAGQTERETSGGEEHGEFNEHVWYSLPTVEKLADRLAADLAAVDPAGTAAYTADAAAFKARVDGLTAAVDPIKAAHAGNKVAITEPVPLYLVQDAGLENATPEEFSEAVEEGTDPSAAVLNDALRALQREGGQGAARQHPDRERLHPAGGAGRRGRRVPSWPSPRRCRPGSTTTSPGRAGRSTSFAALGRAAP